MAQLGRTMLFFALLVYVAQGAVAVGSVNVFDIISVEKSAFGLADSPRGQSHCQSRQKITTDFTHHSHHEQGGTDALQLESDGVMSCCDSSCPMLYCQFFTALLSFDTYLLLGHFPDHRVIYTQNIPNPPLSSLYRPPSFA